MNYLIYIIIEYSANASKALLSSKLFLVISRGKTDLMTLVAFWTLPFFQVYKTCSKNWTCPYLRVKIATGILFCSLDNESHVSSPPEGGERETIAEFLCLRVEEVKVPKGIQVNYKIPLSESSEVFVEKY